MTREYLVERWWEIESPERISNNCYLFADDGNFIEGNSDTLWLIGEWSSSGEDCIDSIYISQYTLSDIDTLSESCFSSIYNGGNSIIICDCTLQGRD